MKLALRRAGLLECALEVGAKGTQQFPQPPHLHLHATTAPGHGAHDSGGIGDSGQAVGLGVCLDLIECPAHSLDTAVVGL